MKWLQEAAAHGSSGAELMIAGMYAAGHGVPRDSVQALAWLEKAANHGNGLAQSYLGMMYAAGKGVAQDNIQAYKWFSLAMLQSRDQVHDIQASQRATLASKMTSEQIALAEELVRTWQTTSASGESPSK